MDDIVVVGGGIVGVASALALLQACPGLSVRLLEKEDGLARHQTGRNSGVIHAGIYYAPGSLKADFCRRGLAATIAFSREHGLPYEQCGKLIVATTALEAQRLAGLEERARQNGLDVRPVSAGELKELEPNISGIAALLSPATGIADYGAITRKMADLIKARGGSIELDCEVVDLREQADRVRVVLANGRELDARYLVACAGVQADRLAVMCGLGSDFAIVPFKGEYYRLAQRHDGVVKHLIYPVPDPALPFLGIHLTRMIGGYVTVGPNAILSLAREGYNKVDLSLRDIAAMAKFPGFWRTIAANLSAGSDELANALSTQRYLDACRRYCPSLEIGDLLPHPSGIRAQAVMRDGTLVHDFLIRNTQRTIHICNAPSPAATSAIPIAEHIKQHAVGTFGLKQAVGAA